MLLIAYTARRYRGMGSSPRQLCLHLRPRVGHCQALLQSCRRLGGEGGHQQLSRRMLEGFERRWKASGGAWMEPAVDHHWMCYFLNHLFQFRICYILAMYCLYNPHTLGFLTLGVLD